MKRPLAAVLAAALVLSTGASPSAASPAAQTANPNCPWVGSTAPAEVKAAQVLALMTLDEKFTVITAQRLVVGVPRLCLPGIYQQGGPGGVNQGATGVTQLPAPIGLAATFNPDLAQRYGSVIGAEERGKATSMVGGPTLDIARSHLGGRTYEAYGEDPYLSGAMGARTVQGIQSQGVISLTKHYTAYTQQTNRLALNVNMDERTLREIYLPAFEMAVKNGQPGAIMCSYAKINGTPSCANRMLLTDVLKGDWGFDGVVAPDWFAQVLNNNTPDGVANAGLDFEVPQPMVFAGPLRAAVESSKVPMSRLDEMVLRILRTMFAIGLVDHPVPTTAQAVVTTSEHQRTGLDTAEQSMVLLKNEAGVLPLDKRNRRIAVIGPDADSYPITTGGLSAGTHADTVVTALDGIRARAGAGTTVDYVEGVEPVTPWNGLLPGLPNVPQSTLTAQNGTPGLTVKFFGADPATPLETRVDPSINYDWSSPGLTNALLYPERQYKPPTGTTTEEWSGTFTAPGTGPYTFDITTGGAAQVRLDDQPVVDLPATGTKTWTTVLRAGSAHSLKVTASVPVNSRIKLGWQPPAGVVDPAIAGAARAAKNADVAIVFANDWSQEGTDKPHLNLPGNQDRLIDAVTKANKNTVVILNTGNAVLMPWVKQARAVIAAWYQGQSIGTAVASVLFGDTDPSGRLPLTFPASADQTPTANNPSRYPGINNEVTFSEGLDVGYRWYDANNVEPLYPFGYGLSYADIKLRDLDVRPTRGDGTYAVNVTVHNTSRRAGTQVVQVYVSTPSATGEPPRQLRAFTKVNLAAGETRRVALSLDPRDFAYWNADTDTWRVDAGRYTVRAGTSSAASDLLLNQIVTVKGMDLPASSPLH